MGGTVKADIQRRRDDARESIYAEIDAERERQDKKHGTEMDLPIVLGEDLRLVEYHEYVQRVYDMRERKGLLSHSLTLVEEVSELVHARTMSEREAEAIQVAACAVKLIEAIRWQRRVTRGTK